MIDPRIVLLALLSGHAKRPEPGPNDCKMCGHGGKTDTGECSYCGTYVCATCGKMHYGLATQPCDGRGVEVPE